MASGSEIAAGAGGAAALIPALFGRGQSSYNAQDISHSGMYDPYAYQFGPKGAESYAGQRDAQAQAIDNRGAFTANYQQADMDRRRALEARANQSTVMNQLMTRAAGTTPSIAQMQADRQMGQAAAQQSALQASARGPAALALSQQTAANNTANVHGAISNQAQQNAANERLQAEQAAFGAASGMRGQDYQSQGQAANQAQFQAGMQQTNRNANDSRAMGYSQMGHQAFGAEQQGRVQQQGIAAQSHANAQSTNAKTDAQNAGSKGLIETVGDFFSDANAKMILPPNAITSDFMAKTALPSVIGGGGMTTSTWGGGGTNPMSGPAPASFDKLTPDGGMDVMGSLQAHSDFGTKFASDPTGGMAGGVMGTSGNGMMVSDARAKKEAFDAGAQAAVRSMSPVTVEGSPSAVRSQGPTAQEDAEFAFARDNPEQYAKNVERDEADERARVRARGAAEFTAQHQDPKWLRAHGATRAAEELEARQAASQQQAEPPPAPSLMASMLNRFSSDFSAKNVGLTRDVFGNAGPGDASAPRMVYVPGQGWADPSKQPAQGLDAAMQRSDGPDFGDVAGQDAAIARMNQGDAQNKAIFDQTRREMAPTRADIAKDDAGRRKMQAEAPDRAAIAKADAEARENGDTTPSAKAGGGKPSFLAAFAQASQGLNEAQFGGNRFSSDFKSKRVVDLDNDVDVDNDPGGQDFDADEYIESKAPKPYARPEGVTRATPEDGPRIRRAIQDNASADADSIMAGFGASLDRGSSVDLPAKYRSRQDFANKDPEGFDNWADSKGWEKRPEDRYEADSPQDRSARAGLAMSPEAQAARTMKGFPYAYKPGLGPKDQAPGEMNFGFMTQNLRQSPIAATAVKKNPQTGLDEVDAHKMIKVMASTIADLQEQQDDTRLMLAKGGRKMRA